MKLTYAQLDAHLSKPLLPVYIISGDDIFLKNDALNSIRKAAKVAGFTERTRMAPEAGIDWNQLHNALYATSFFAEKRVLELDFRQGTPPKTATSILEEYSKHPIPETLLLIDISKADDKITRSTWYKALDKIGATLTIWPLSREQLPQWIMQRIKKYKLQINTAAANLLADYVEGNLVAAAQTIEKIYLLQPKKIIDVEFIECVLTDESQFTVFDFIEHLIAGNRNRALHILEHLQSAGDEPVLILWGIARELRLLADLAELRKHGQPLESLFQKYRIFFKRQSAVRQFLNKYHAEDCWQHLTKAAEVDQIIKGAIPGQPWDKLQELCLRITQ